ncbi:MAG TPA: hypothetical protein VGN46_02550 [Luteibacter sp.]|jgi:type 1 fimbria pilin|uniref:fimbrial protein n=1 Tax=Luteibacter sp. TaxID=1886636 RepID=UPI002F3E507F
MNLKLISSALLVAGLAAPAAFAETGTITFTGKITNVPFALHMESCSDPVGLAVRFRFGREADAEPGHPGWFSLSGPENVALELGDESKATIAPGHELEKSAVRTGGRYDFNVRLRETRDTVRGGTFRRPITVEVRYL